MHIIETCKINKHEVNLNFEQNVGLSVAVTNKMLGIHILRIYELSITVKTEKYLMWKRKILIPTFFIV